MSNTLVLFRVALFAFLHSISLAIANAQQAPLENTLSAFVTKSELAGAVAVVADKDKILQTTTVGYADVDAKEPMKEDSIFWIASQSKPMTAVAVMMLVDEGKIALDDPIEKYLPEFRGQMVIAEKDDNHQLLRKPSHPITVRETLSHMSGMPFKSAIPIASRVASETGRLLTEAGRLAQAYSQSLLASRQCPVPHLHW